MQVSVGSVQSQTLLTSQNSFGFDNKSESSSDGNMVIITKTSYDLRPPEVGGSYLKQEFSYIRGFSQTADGDANNNTVYINTQDFSNPVLMRFFGDPNVDTSDVEGSIAGASAITGSLSGNQVVVESSFVRAWSIYGAYRTNTGSEAPDSTVTLTNNTVWLKDSHTIQYIDTQYNQTPDFIHDYKHGGIVVAASSGLGGDHNGGHEVRAENNTLVIEGGAVSYARLAGFVAGDGEYASGSRDYFVANNNGVFIDGGQDFYLAVDERRYGYLYGHHGFAGESATGEWKGELNGGFVDVRDSRITLSGRWDAPSSSFTIAGGHTGSKLLSNSVEITGSTLEISADRPVDTVIMGAYANTYHTNENVEIVAEGNWVTLDKVEQLGDGWTGAYGAQIYGKTLEGKVLAGVQVTNNSIEVRNNSAIKSARLVGAWLDAKPAESDKYILTGNSVTIENSTFDGTEIIAAQVGDISDLGAGTVKNNLVHIGKGVTEADGSTLSLDYLAGGAAASEETSYQGNRLVLESRTQTEKLIGFQDFEFNLNNQTLAEGQALLTVTEAPVVLATQASEHLGGETSKIVLTGKLPETGEIVLINSKQGFQEYLTGDVIAAGELNLTEGQALEVNTIESVIRTSQTTIASDSYELSIRDNGTVADATAAHDQSLVVTIGQTEPGPGPGPSGNDSINDQTNTLVESSLSALATAFAADDLFVDTVLRSRDGKRDGLFAAARAGMYSYDTNTRLETNIVSGLVGFSASVGESNVGAFLEMGHASYDSRLNSSLGQVRGQGSHNYAGVGIFADYALPVEGWRLTGYVKGGSLNNDFSAMIAGVDAGYDKSSAYWGAHLGTHYDIDMPSMRTRVFASYFYDGRESESYDIAGTADVGGAHIKYDSLNAHRVQFGSMFEFKMSDTWRPYLGLTFEQIVAAEAKGTATDAQGTMDLNSSDLEGSTGILSAGWTYQDGNFSTELGLNGYAGTRNGVSGQIQANWKF